METFAKMHYSRRRVGFRNHLILEFPTKLQLKELKRFPPVITRSIQQRNLKTHRFNVKSDIGASSQDKISEILRIFAFWNFLFFLRTGISIAIERQ